MSNPLYYPNRDMLASGFPTNWTLLKRLMWVRIMQGGSIAPTYETVTGNPVSFTTVRSAPLKQLSVAFSPVQSGTGDPSPDNVRPISGWDSLTVYHSGADTSNPQTISINIGQTVYSGYVDVVSGVVTVTHKVYNLQNVRQDRILAYDSGGKHGVYFQYALDHAGTRMQGVCNMAVVDTGSSSSLPSYMWFGVNSANVFWVGILDVLGLADVSAFKTWLASNEVWICYPMATPTEIQLTPQEVESLLGENNVWSNANQPLTVTYRSN